MAGFVASHKEDRDMAAPFPIKCCDEDHQSRGSWNVVPHACGYAAALPPEGEQFAPRDGPSALMGEDRWLYSFMDH